MKNKERGTHKKVTRYINYNKSHADEQLFRLFAFYRLIFNVSV